MDGSKWADKEKGREGKTVKIKYLIVRNRRTRTTGFPQIEDAENDTQDRKKRKREGGRERSQRRREARERRVVGG
jgi:hypothetical protein